MNTRKEMNQEFQVEAKTNIGVCTFLVTPKREHKATLAKAEALRSTLDQLGRKHAGKLQFPTFYSIKKSWQKWKVAIFTLGHSSTITKDEWDKLWQNIYDALNEIGDCSLYADDWSTDLKFQLRAEITLLFETK